MMSDFKVTFDAGHGGADSGAIHRRTGLKESDMALDVCQRARRILDGVLEVFLTRISDKLIKLRERAEMSNEVDSDAFVSVHFNSATSPDTASSWEVFTTRGQNRSDSLADALGKWQGKVFRDMKRRADFADGDLDKERNFTVLVPTDHPSALMEFEFIHTEHGRMRIADPSEREKMAYVLALGVCEFFGLTDEVQSLCLELSLFLRDTKESGAKVVEAEPYEAKTPADFVDVGRRLARLETEVFGTEVKL